MKTTENKKIGQEPDILFVSFLFVCIWAHPPKERKKENVWKSVLECETSTNILEENKVVRIGVFGNRNWKLLTNEL